MRRLLVYLSVLMAAVVMAVLGTRLTRAEHAAQAQYEAQFAAASEAAEELTAALEKASLTSPGDVQADLLLTIARSGNTARTSLAAMPLDAESSAAVTAVLNEVTAQADALLCSLAAGHALDNSDMTALTRHAALCERLCAQLALIHDQAQRGAYLASAEEAAPLMGLLNAAVCCEGDLGGIAPVAERPVPRGLPAETVTQEEAIRLAMGYVSGASSAEPAPNTSGVLPAYGVTVATGDLRLNLELTQRGGRLLMMSPETAAFPQRCTREEARLAVDDYLLDHGFGAMQEAAWQRYDGLYMAAMVPVQDGALLYPDVVHLQVRMDTAQVVGFEASAYWTNHVTRKLPAPRLTPNEVLALLPGDLPHSGAQLCLLPTSDGEVLAYQVQARRGDEAFLLFYSAEDGAQLALQRLLTTENGQIPA